MAISQESYGRGQPVYSNGSHAPTTGTVDPSGYIDRSLNNPSDSRSGLAAAALDRLSGNGSMPQQSPGVLPLGDVTTLTITPTGQLIPNAPQPSQAEVGSMQPALDSSALSGMGAPNVPTLVPPLMQAALSRLIANRSSQ